MTDPVTQHDLECIAWRAEHNGWVKTEWRQQHLLNEMIERRFRAMNKEMDDKFTAVGLRISILEKRVVWVIAVTTILVQVASRYFLSG